MPLIDYPQRSPDWYVARKGKITASFAAAVLGLDPWMGPLAAFNQITGRRVRDDNSHMAWGREKEATAVFDYEVATSQVVLPTGLWTHPTLEWLAASPDGLIGDKGLLEVKCPSSKLPTEIPGNHEIQMRVQMACTERLWGVYWAWMPPPALPFLSAITRDMEKERWLLNALKEWYEAYLKPDIAPPRRRPQHEPENGTANDG